MYHACLDELHPALECAQLFRKTSIESMTGKAENMGLFRSADIRRYAGRYIDTGFRRLMNNNNVWLPSTCRGNISHAVVAMEATYTQVPRNVRGGKRAFIENVRDLTAFERPVRSLK